MTRKIIAAAFALLAAAPLFARVPFRPEVHVAYGLAPVTDWVDTYNDMLADAFAGPDTDLTGWGTVTAGLDLHLIGSLSLGVGVVYSSNRERDRRSEARIENRYWSLMPGVKWGWLDLKIVSLYSRAAAGASFVRARTDGRSASSTEFAFQVSPLCVEVGGRVAAFAEAGIGTSGCAIFGVRYRF